MQSSQWQTSPHTGKRWWQGYSLLGSQAVGGKLREGSVREVGHSRSCLAGVREKPISYSTCTWVEWGSVEQGEHLTSCTLPCSTVSS